jgi:hypothetical protein
MPWPCGLNREIKNAEKTWARKPKKNYFYIQMRGKLQIQCEKTIVWGCGLG